MEILEIYQKADAPPGSTGLASVVLAFIPGCGGGGGNSVVEVFDGQCIVENIIGIGSG